MSAAASPCRMRERTPPEPPPWAARHRRSLRRASGGVSTDARRGAALTREGGRKHPPGADPT
eukprot:8354295-Alexandrium_andersonii.AAC.1